MAAAVALAQGNGYFGHGGFAIGVEQFGAVENHAVVFLACSGEESGNVYECHQRNVECVAEADEACAFARCVAVEHAGKVFGLVGNHAHALSVEAGEAHDEVFGVVALDFQEFAVVDNGTDYLVHVVGACCRVGNDFVEAVLEAVDGVVALNQRGFFEVVLGNVAKEFADDLQGFFAILGGEMAHAALGGVHFRTAQGVLAHVFAGNGLHHLGSGKEHVADALCHDGEVGEGGGVHGAAGAGAEDAADLGNHAGGHDVALEDFGIAGQCVDAFLDACAARVVEADYGSAHLHGHVHDLADFQGHCFGQ